MDELLEFLSAPGNKAMSSAQVQLQMKDWGVWWRCYVIRLFPSEFERVLGEGRHFLRVGKNFKKTRAHWLSYQVRLEVGISSWSEVAPVYQRPEI